MSIPKRAALGLAATATALILTACSSSASVGSSGGSAGAAPSTTSAGTAPSTGAPAAAGADWARNPDQSSTARKAGLSMLGGEMLQVHYHAHLDVIVDGKPVTVPELVGIDENAQTITALHTHDTSGVMHIESAKDTPFQLGQFFTEWGQPLTATQVGPVAISGDEVLRVYVNGKQLTTDPAQYVLKSHDEIVVWVGDKAQTPQVPASYDFPPGL